MSDINQDNPVIVETTEMVSQETKRNLSESEVSNFVSKKLKTEDSNTSFEVEVLETKNNVVFAQPPSKDMVTNVLAKYEAQRHSCSGKYPELHAAISNYGPPEFWLTEYELRRQCDDVKLLQKFICPSENINADRVLDVD